MAFSSFSSSSAHDRAPGAGVTAVLGPTNTGKTHLAIERMVAHSSWVIGLPLRLLAREVYNKIVGKVGVDLVALITGEEKIKPPKARYWVSTVEAMPRDLDVSFLAVDEGSGHECRQGRRREHEVDLEPAVALEALAVVVPVRPTRRVT